MTYADAMDQFERKFIRDALADHHWIVTATAKCLKISRRTIQRKRNYHGIEKPEGRYVTNVPCGCLKKGNG